MAIGYMYTPKGTIREDGFLRGIPRYSIHGSPKMYILENIGSVYIYLTDELLKHK